MCVCEREREREGERDKAIYLYVKSVSSVLSPIMYFEPDVRYIDIKNNVYLKKRRVMLHHIKEEQGW